MEELKKRLKFNDITVRSRCLQKLVHAVKRKARGELITSSSVQIPELSLIWETCLDDSITTSKLAVQAIIYLATNRYIDVKYAINKLLGSISSSNAYSIVKGITRLLIHESNRDENNISLYSIHQQRHPLISVLQTSDDYLPLIFESIADAISENNLRGFQTMEPVICYILSNPNPKRRNDYSKTLLLETLIDTVKNEPKTAFYILRCIPFLQVDDLQQVAETSNFVINAKRAFTSLQCGENDRIYITELLLLSSLSLCDRSLVTGFDPVRLFDLAMDSSMFLSQLNYTSPYVNVCLVLIAIILKRSSGELIEKCTSLGLVLLNFKDVSPTVAAFLAFSVIQLLPEPSVISFGESTNTILSQFLEKLEAVFLRESQLENPSLNPKENLTSSKAPEEISIDHMICIETFTFTVESSLLCAKFASKLDESDNEFKLQWLESIANAVKCGSVDNLDVVFSLVAALFLISPDDRNYLQSCLDAFEAILLKNTYLSTQIFALLLYKQNLLKSPESKVLILEFFPKCATHKFSIPPVLSILKMMSNVVELKAEAIYLMLQLWKKQDRCFSYLHKLLIENNKTIDNDLGVNETLISQTAAIREICQIAPEKHGVEFLGTLSKVFNDSNDEATSPAACLALDGVINLCKSEITDLRSTWKVLGPKLSKDKRPLVICRMYKLLALVPELPVKSCEYDQFMSEIVLFIWKRISSGMMPVEAVSAAYKTLAKFPMSCHILKQLPPAAKANLQLPASMKATPFEMSKLPEDVLTYIPGHCFIDLLESLENNVTIEGYTEFLNSALKQEVEDLPRSVYSQRKHLQKRQNANEALSKVPNFLCNQFESKKSPTLQKNLAVGVLLCYEPPLEFGKDGQPVKRSIATQYRFYEQVLGVLLNEVNIDTTEWQRCILLPNAWGGFMDRAFVACEESRKAELDLQRSLGHREFSPEEFNLQCKYAWLWVRDRILNLIKISVKNAPTSHANAVFAVAGLVNAISKFRSTLDDNTKSLCDESESHVCHQIFAEECTETILCAMIPNHQPNGKVHSWLLTHLSRPNSSAAFLVRGCSSSSLCHLTSVLTNTHSSEIPRLFQDLLNNLSHSSPVLSFYSGIGLGLLTKSLCDIGYANSGESQLELLLNTAKEIQNIYNKEDDPPSSVLISLTMIMTVLSHIDQEEIKDWISTTCDFFHEKLMEEEVSSMQFETLSVCVSAMIISAVDGSCKQVDSVLSLASWFEEQHSDLPQCSGVSVSSGMLIEALERFGHSRGSEMKQKIQKEWFNTVASEKKPTLHKIASLNGLCSLFSCGRGLLQVKKREGDLKTSTVNELISLMFQLLNAGRDTGLQTICSWEVGRLYSVHSFQQETDESVPSTYSYLGEKSILKPLVMMIINSEKSGEVSPKECHVLSCLKALGGVYPRPLPPLNWSSILIPFLEKNDDSMVNASLNIALYRANGSPYATNVLSSYSSPPLFHTLPETSQHLLFKNIPELAVVLPPHRLKIFLQTVISLSLKSNKESQTLCCITLQGIQDAFKLSGLKQQTLSVLQEQFIYIFKHFKKDLKLIRTHLKCISDTLMYFSEKKVESLLSCSSNSEDLPVSALILCYLVRTERKTLSSLRPLIEESKHSNLNDKEQICTALYECFLPSCENEKSEINQQEKCISWLFQIIGWINILNDAKSQYKLLSVGEVFLFFNDVCFATIIGCSGLECSYNFYPNQNLSHHALLQNLPIALTKLCVKEEWEKVTDKIINWLMLLIQSPHMTDSDKHFVKLSLCAIRGTGEFKKLDVWTDVTCSIY